MDFQQNDVKGVSISRLSDVPAFAPLLASAHAREWGHLYANWNQDVALADFQMENGSSDLPVTWVLQNRTDTVMGSISLVQDDLPNHPELNPWLASLLVFPEFQGHGWGRILIQKALEVLRHYRYRHAYLFTENKVPFFSKFNFSIYGQAQAEGHGVTIMKWTNPEAAKAESPPPGPIKLPLRAEKITPSSQTRTGWDLAPETPPPGPIKLPLRAEKITPSSQTRTGWDLNPR